MIEFLDLKPSKFWSQITGIENIFCVLSLYSEFNHSDWQPQLVWLYWTNLRAQFFYPCHLIIRTNQILMLSWLCLKIFLTGSGDLRANHPTVAIVVTIIVVVAILDSWASSSQRSFLLLISLDAVFREMINYLEMGFQLFR